jgi:hypothetical protein
MQKSSSTAGRESINKKFMGLIKVFKLRGAEQKK